MVLMGPGCGPCRPRSGRPCPATPLPFTPFPPPSRGAPRSPLLPFGKEPGIRDSPPFPLKARPQRAFTGRHVRFMPSTGAHGRRSRSAGTQRASGGAGGFPRGLVSPRDPVAGTASPRHGLDRRGRRVRAGVHLSHRACACVSVRVRACTCVSMRVRVCACPCVSVRARACPCVSMRACAWGGAHQLSVLGAPGRGLARGLAAVAPRDWPGCRGVTAGRGPGRGVPCEELRRRRPPRKG